MSQGEFDAMQVELLRQATEGCCMNDKWRGRTCGYHEGFYDGTEAVWEALKERSLDNS